MKKLTLRLRRDPESSELLLSEVPPHGNVAEEDITNLGEVSLIDSKDPVTGQPNQFWSGWLFGKTNQFGNHINLDGILDEMLGVLVEDDLHPSNTMVFIRQEDLDEYLEIRKKYFAKRQSQTDTDS